VGGTHPALIEAMGVGNCVIAKDTPENHEVLADAGLFFRDADDLAGQLRRTLADDALVTRLRSCAQSRAKQYYSWDAVTDAYEKLFQEMVERKNGRELRKLRE
jgi:glycosyltransferase involved in cell wall biosynthesis